MRSINTPILECGALVDVEVGPAALFRAAIQKSGRAQPPTTRATLLVDTGASHTFIDEGVMRTLQLEPTSTAKFHSTSTNGVAEPCRVFDVAMVLGSNASQNALRFDTFRVMSNPFINQPYDGLLGRDILDRLQLHWNGPTRQLVLLYP